MPGIARVGPDTAGATITGGSQSTVFFNGSVVTIMGDGILHRVPN